MNIGLGIINRYKHLISKLSPYLISGLIVFLFVAHWVFTFYIIYLRIPLIDIVWYLWLLCLYLGIPLSILLYIVVALYKGILKRQPFVIKVALSFIYLLVWFSCIYIYDRDSPNFVNMKADFFKKHSHQYKQFAEKVIAENKKKLSVEEDLFVSQDIPRDLPARDYILHMSSMGSDSTYDVSFEFFVYPMGYYSYITNHETLLRRQKKKGVVFELEKDWYYISYF